MALPDDIRKLHFTPNGSPWFSLVAKSTIDANSLSFTPNGAPWWGMYGINGEQPILGHIKAVNQVDWAKVKSYMGVNKANIKTISNVEG
jgi:putative heme iron utilization protein